MNIAISGASAHAHSPHTRTANFGALNSAIARGDLDAAKTALTAINESIRRPALAAKAKGTLDAVGAAIASGDLAAARKTLADFRSGRLAKAEAVVTPAPPAPVPDTAPVTEPAAEVGTVSGLDANVEIAAPQTPVADTLSLLSGSGRAVDLLV